MADWPLRLLTSHPRPFREGLLSQLGISAWRPCWSRFAGLWEGQTRCEFTRLSSRRGRDLQGLAWRRSVRWSRANAVVADADPDFGGGDRGCNKPRNSLSSLTKWLSLTTMTWSKHSRRRVPQQSARHYYAIGSSRVKAGLLTGDRSGHRPDRHRRVVPRPHPNQGPHKLKLRRYRGPASEVWAGSSVTGHSRWHLASPPA